jgi:hypothetical protein
VEPSFERGLFFLERLEEPLLPDRDLRYPEAGDKPDPGAEPSLPPPRPV